MSGRVVLNAVGKSTLKSFRNQIAKEIEKRDGELIAVNQVLSLPGIAGRRANGASLRIATHRFAALRVTPQRTATQRL
jgi:hypothetical protein